MLKYLLIVLLIIATGLKAKAQTLNDPARDEFIEMMDQQAKNEKYLQQRAQFKGGPGVLYDYLQSHIIYPEKAKKEGLSAQVFVSFEIDYKTGLPGKPKIVESSNKLFDAEAIRLIKSMPAWIPARQQDQNVTSDNTVLIYFHLK